MDVVGSLVVFRPCAAFELCIIERRIALGHESKWQHQVQLCTYALSNAIVSVSRPSGCSSVSITHCPPPLSLFAPRLLPHPLRFAKLAHGANVVQFLLIAPLSRHIAAI